MNTGRKLIFIDTETGGIKPYANPLLQLAGIVEVDSEVKEEFNHFIKPFPGQTLIDSALKINGITQEQIDKDFIEPNLVFKRFVTMLGDYVDKFDKNDKFHFIGYNVKFDEDFLRQFFLNNCTSEVDKKYGNGFGSWFYTPTIDVMQMAAIDLMDKRDRLPDFKLKTVCNYYGIGTACDWHDAMADIKATRELYIRLFWKETHKDELIEKVSGGPDNDDLFTYGMGLLKNLNTSVEQEKVAEEAAKLFEDKD